LDSARIQSELDAMVNAVVDDGSTAQAVYDSAFALYQNLQLPPALRAQAAYVVGNWFNSLGQTDRICEWFQRARDLAPTMNAYASVYNAFCQ
jgi:hypothetical protein